MIRYLDAFSDFNPLNDELSEAQLWDIGYVVQHAKLLLDDSFTEEDLNAGLEILFKLKKYSSHAGIKLLNELPSKHQEVGLTTTPPFNYYLCTDYVEQECRPNGEPYLWSQLFAVLALASIADYVYLTKKSVYEYQPGDDQDLMLQYKNAENNEQGYKVDLKLEAIEALGFARLFEKIQSDPNKRAKSISKTKLSNYHPLKLAIIEKFNKLNRDGKSIRKIARIINDELPDELKYLSSTDDLEKQIEKWLAQYIKGTLPGQDKLPPYKP
ncbi:MAG: hypothetical protein CMP91_12940 [Gammaproteobacteria bacterium]|nr:hypothetical protein [Gammaproteobacteria bacterium]|tara:strand:+ start:3848 stop:4654 length:807 start_codon:yes stop_codon:yes gene_type:complete